MNLYSLTLQKQQFAIKVARCKFSKKIKNGFIINKKNIIELYTVSKLGEIQLIQSTFLFGDLRDFDILLLPMNVIDYITCTSSSGTFIILKFCVNKKWKILLKHFFSRSGLRRNIPGYYLKNDYLGRISIISAVEKIRYIYIYSNIKYSKKIICSPIEVHKTNTLITDIQALENYYENPFFASLEIDLAEAHKNLTCTRDNVEFQIYDLKKKYIVFYEFDIGLNILITSFLDKITHNTHIIIPVRDIYHSKPYCMICDGTFIILKNKIFDDIYCRFPSKVGNPKNFRKSIILYLISRLNRRHFYFVQNDLGDLFKISISSDSFFPKKILLKYYDSIAPCTNIAMLNKGFILGVTDYGPCFLFKFKASSVIEDTNTLHSIFCLNYSNVFIPCYYKHSLLTNLIYFKKLFFISRIKKFKIFPYDKLQNTTNISLLKGCGFCSNVCYLLYGIDVKEISFSIISGKPKNIWSLKNNYNEILNSFIILTFNKLTVTLKIDTHLKESSDLLLRNNIETLNCHRLVDYSIIQVFKEGIRRIKAKNIINQWDINNDDKIIFEAANKYQIVVSRNNCFVNYFKINSDKELCLVKESKFDIQFTQICLTHFENIWEICTYFSAYGENDHLVFVISLDSLNTLSIIKTFNLPSKPSSVGTFGSKKKIILYISFANGTILKIESKKDKIEKKFPRVRFIGFGENEISHLRYHMRLYLLILSNITLIGSFNTTEFAFKPIRCKTIQKATYLDFQNNTFIISLVKDYLYIFTLYHIETDFRLRFNYLNSTGLTFLIHPSFMTHLIIQTSYFANYDKKIINDSKYFTSYLQIIDHESMINTDFLDFPLCEQLTCLKILDSCVKKKKVTFLLVGSKDLSNLTGFVYLFRLFSNCKRIRLIHKTKIENFPFAISSYYKYILVGSRNTVLFFEIGRKKLLFKRKMNMYNLIPKILMIFGDRLAIANMNEGLIIAKVSSNTYAFKSMAYTIQGKFIHSILFLDFDSICTTDLMGNLLVFRLPKLTGLKINYDPKGFSEPQSRYTVNSYKLFYTVCTYLGDIATGCSKFKLLPWKNEVILYVTMGGSMGCLLPIKKKNELMFFKNLYIFLNTIQISIILQTHTTYRSSFYKTRGILDGDFCEFSLFYNKSRVKNLSFYLKIKRRIITNFLSDLKFRMY